MYGPTARKWDVAAISATRGTQLGAILRATFNLDNGENGTFQGKASVTSDGFIMCDFIDKRGVYHHQAFVGSVRDLEHNVVGLGTFLNLSTADTAALYQKIRDWVAADYRPSSHRGILGA